MPEVDRQPKTLLSSASTEAWGAVAEFHDSRDTFGFQVTYTSNVGLDFWIRGSVDNINFHEIPAVSSVGSSASPYTYIFSSRSGSGISGPVKYLQARVEDASGTGTYSVTIKVLAL